MFTQIAYEESGREEDIEQTMTELSSAIHRIQLTKDFQASESIQAVETLHCAAIKLLEAIVVYLTVALARLERSFVSKAPIN